MELIDLKVTYTESTEKCFNNLNRFNSRSLDSKVKAINACNNRAKKRSQSEGKTNIVFEFTDGTTYEMNYEIGRECLLISTLAMKSNNTIVYGRLEYSFISQSKSGLIWCYVSGRE